MVVVGAPVGIQEIVQGVLHGLLSPAVHGGHACFSAVLLELLGVCDLLAVLALIELPGQSRDGKPKVAGDVAKEFYGKAGDAIRERVALAKEPGHAYEPRAFDLLGYVDTGRALELARARTRAKRPFEDDGGLELDRQGHGLGLLARDLEAQLELLAGLDLGEVVVGEGGLGDLWVVDVLDSGRAGPLGVVDDEGDGDVGRGRGRGADNLDRDGVLDIVVVAYLRGRGAVEDVDVVHGDIEQVRAAVVDLEGDLEGVGTAAVLRGGHRGLEVLLHIADIAVAFGLGRDRAVEGVAIRVVVLALEGQVADVDGREAVGAGGDADLLLVVQRRDGDLHATHGHVACGGLAHGHDRNLVFAQDIDAKVRVSRLVCVGVDHGALGRDERAQEAQGAHDGGGAQEGAARDRWVGHEGGRVAFFGVATRCAVGVCGQVLGLAFHGAASLVASALTSSDYRKVAMCRGVNFCLRPAQTYPFR